MKVDLEKIKRKLRDGMKLLMVIFFLGSILSVNVYADEIQNSAIRVFNGTGVALIPLGQNILANLYGKGLPGVQPIIRIRIRPKVRLWDSSISRPQSSQINIRYGLGNTQLNSLNVLAPVNK